MSGCPSGLRKRSAKPCFVGSNPTPDSISIYLLMDRKLRRELSKRKWISRAKKVYNSCRKFYIPVNGIKAGVQYNVPILVNRALRICESITDFLNGSKYAKILNNCSAHAKVPIPVYTQCINSIVTIIATKTAYPNINSNVTIIPLFLPLQETC